MPSKSFSSRLRITVALLVLLALGGCQEGISQEGGTLDSGGRLPPPQAAYDVTHYDLAVRVLPERQALAGRVTVRAAVTDTLRGLLLDLDARLTVDGARQLTPADTTTLPHERRADGDRLWVDLPGRSVPGDTVVVAVAYRGQPRTAPNPPWEGGVTWATTPGGAPWIATSCQTIGADVWWPVKDHPSDEPDSMDIALTVPDTLVGASNGALRDVERASDSTRTYRWHVSAPINTYNVTMNVAPYARIDTTYASVAGTVVPARFYALPSDSAWAAAALPEFLHQVRFLEERLGPYPPRADKYGVAQTPFLGMEHQSLIAYGHTFSDGGLGYDAPFDALHFHELAHEWYGNLVTARDWKDFWLHEGPATYLEALYAEHLRGDSAYHAVTDYFRQQVQGGTPVARRAPTSAQAVYHRDVYYRGALTLHTLRYVVGETALHRILRRFAYPKDTSAQPPPFRSVTTRDFVRVAEAVTGRTLDTFFDVYLYRDRLPALETERDEGTFTLRWTGTGDVPFEVPVPVQVGDSTRRVAMAGGTGQVAVPSDTEVTVDPKGWVLRRR